jgi:hypothetical protein
VWIPLVLGLAGYIGLAVIVAAIEHDIWRNCEILRRKIIHYSNWNPESELSPDDLADTGTCKHPFRVYVLASIAVVMCAGSSAALASRIEWLSPVNPGGPAEACCSHTVLPGATGCSVPAASDAIAADPTKDALDTGENIPDPAEASSSK